MRKKIVFTHIISVLFFFTPLLIGAEEERIIIGGTEGWDRIGLRNNISEIEMIRKNTALALSSAKTVEDSTLDLVLSFDESSAANFVDSTGHYQVHASSGVNSASFRMARHGPGAALFSEAPLILSPTREALFSSGKRFGSFSIEFWIYPSNMENGEQIFSWSAGRRSSQGEYLFQQISCQVTRNRMEWTLIDLFSSPADDARLALNLSSRTTVLPRVWSHHLLRFDAETGLLEYLVNGNLDDVSYTTNTGHEGGDVYTPIIGDEGSLILAPRFIGMMDEVYIYTQYVENPILTRYPMTGGRLESKFIDLGSTGASILRLEALGDENAWDPVLDQASGADIQYFLRSTDTPYIWTDDELSWMPVKAGLSLQGLFIGRWVQLAAQLYPSGDGEMTPYLDELRIWYESPDPLKAPTQLRALAQDGAVELSWKASIEANLGGYLVYYGTDKGTYFGSDAILGPSPINVGNRTSIRIDGLHNGRLYYFSVAAYDTSSPSLTGEFSREVMARPIRMTQ